MSKKLSEKLDEFCEYAEADEARELEAWIEWAKGIFLIEKAVFEDVNAKLHELMARAETAEAALASLKETTIDVETYEDARAGWSDALTRIQELEAAVARVRALAHKRDPRGMGALFQETMEALDGPPVKKGEILFSRYSWEGEWTTHRPAPKKEPREFWVCPTASGFVECDSSQVPDAFKVREVCDDD